MDKQLTHNEEKIVGTLADNICRNDDEIERQGVVEKATAIINSKRAQEGIEDLCNASISLGLPAVRILFEAMIDTGSGNSSQKNDLRVRVRKLCQISIETTGCFKIDFLNTQTNCPDTVYLVLDACAAGHDLTAEFDKILSFVEENKQEKIKSYMSGLVSIARNVFRYLVEENRELVSTILKYQSEGFIPDLKVDMSNTTLYVGDEASECQNRRVGLFVRRETSVC